MTISQFNPNSFRRYFESTAWLLFDRGLRIIILFLVWMQVTRYLGPERYGILSYAISIASIFMFLTDLGLSDILMKELVSAKNESQKNALMGTSLGLRFFGGILLVGLTYLITVFVNYDSLMKKLILIIAIGYLLEGFNVVIVYFQTIVKSKYIAIVQLLQTIVTSIIKYSLVLVHASLVAFAVLSCIENYFLALGLIYIYQTKIKKIFHWKFNFSVGKELLQQSWPLILTNIVVILYLRIDQIMIKHMLNDTAIGHYSAALRIYQTWFFIPTLIVLIN